MREVLGPLLAGWHQGGTAGLATVVRTFESAPRPAGASMLVTPGGEVVGSVSGGCVEGAVYDLASQVVADGRPVLVRYGISDDDAFAVGLTCGGILDVFVEPVSRQTFERLDAVRQDVDDSQPVGVATVIEHPDTGWAGRHLVVRPHGHEGSVGSERADRAIGEDGQGLLAAGRNAVLTYGPDGERQGEGMRVFFNSFAPRPRMFVFGAIDFAAALTRLAAFLGYRVTVCDARAVFATPARFPDADEVIVAWPHRYLAEQIAAGLVDERAVICVLTHDPKFDVPLLEVALRAPQVAYIGAMGSTANPRRPAAASARGGRGRAGARAPAQPDRTRPGFAHPGGNGRLDRVRDHCAALGRQRRAAARPGRADPPRRPRGAGPEAAAEARARPLAER